MSRGSKGETKPRLRADLAEHLSSMRSPHRWVPGPDSRSPEKACIAGSNYPSPELAAFLAAVQQIPGENESRSKEQKCGQRLTVKPIAHERGQGHANEIHGSNDRGIDRSRCLGQAKVPG